MPNDTRKIWLVIHPIGQYNEDVKDLARRNHLRIIDAVHSDRVDPDLLTDAPPELTIREGCGKRKGVTAEAEAILEKAKADAQAEAEAILEKAKADAAKLLTTAAAKAAKGNK